MTIIIGENKSERQRRFVKQLRAERDAAIAQAAQDRQRVEALEAVTDDLCRTVMFAMTVGHCNEGACDHPACGIIRSVRRARAVLAAAGSPDASAVSDSE